MNTIQNQRAGNYWIGNVIETNTNNTYYVRLSKFESMQPEISFKQSQNSLFITYKVWLDGNFRLPPNTLIMNLETSIGSISNLVLHEIQEGFVCRRYETSFNINLNTNSTLSGDKFLEEILLSASFDVNKDIFNNSDLGYYKMKFYDELVKLNFNDSIHFNNYFPISKLSEYYINSSYKSDYKNLEVLPKDFYDWSTKKMTIYPEFWFNKATLFEDLDCKPINHLYKANSNKVLLSRAFDKVSVVVNYYIDNKDKKLDLDFSNVVDTNLNSNNNLYLGVRTLYNFENKELYQSSNGVSGIYFPVNTYGNLTITLEKNGIKYRDRIPFNFKNEFYSSRNNNIIIEVEEFFQVSGQWTEVAYA